MHAAVGMDVLVVVGRGRTFDLRFADTAAAGGTHRFRSFVGKRRNTLRYCALRVPTL
jgi:hypothetical protein